MLFRSRICWSASTYIGDKPGVAMNSDERTTNLGQVWPDAQIYGISIARRVIIIESDPTGLTDFSAADL